MKVVVCDTCESAAGTYVAESQWIKVANGTWAEGVHTEHHFCTWTCLASYVEEVLQSDNG